MRWFNPFNSALCHWVIHLCKYTLWTALRRWREMQQQEQKSLNVCMNVSVSRRRNCDDDWTTKWWQHLVIISRVSRLVIVSRCIGRPQLLHTDTHTSRSINRDRSFPLNKIKSNQIALLATAPLIRSTGVPSTGLQLPNTEQYNAYKQQVLKMWNFEPSLGICPFLWNFSAFTEFCRIRPWPVIRGQIWHILVGFRWS